MAQKSRKDLQIESNPKNTRQRKATGQCRSDAQKRSSNAKKKK